MGTLLISVNMDMQANAVKLDVFQSSGSEKEVRNLERSQVED